ncbi:hypothetical protein D9M72_459570 [compost metagenome]
MPAQFQQCGLPQPDGLFSKGADHGSPIVAVFLPGVVQRRLGRRRFVEELAGRELFKALSPIARERLRLDAGLAQHVFEFGAGFVDELVDFTGQRGVQVIDDHAHQPVADGMGGGSESATRQVQRGAQRGARRIARARNNADQVYAQARPRQELVDFVLGLVGDQRNDVAQRIDQRQDVAQHGDSSSHCHHALQRDPVAGHAAQPVVHDARGRPDVLC